MKSNYSDPKIFTGGVDVNSWSKLSSKEKNQALTKDWYVYYSFRNPKTGRLVRQTNIKAGVNRYKDKRTRLHILKVLQQSLDIVLREGFNPYKDNRTLAEYLQNKINGKEDNPAKAEIRRETISNSSEEEVITIEIAFDKVLKLKQQAMNDNSYIRYKSRITRFYRYLQENGFSNDDNIHCITKKNVIQYLNVVLLNSSPRNRNNTRSDIASFFQTLEDNDFIKENFVKKINVLKSIPERNRTYTPREQSKIFMYLKENDPVLHLFVKFVSYNFLRPIEVCRLRIGDIDIHDKKLYVRAKNQPVKIKIIPDILISAIPDLSSFKKEDHLFAENKIGGKWDTKENNKRDYFTKRFKKVKDHFGFDANYGLYSFRHTFITKLYQEMVKSASPFEVKSKLKLITGHSTMKALEQYLRDIDAALPEDYSKLLG